jgi:hypothetical protein
MEDDLYWEAQVMDFVDYNLQADDFLAKLTRYQSGLLRAIRQIIAVLDSSGKAGLLTTKRDPISVIERDD